MPFAPVKSDPFKRKRKSSESPLWPASVWKVLEKEYFNVDLIREANAALPEKFRPHVLMTDDAGRLSFVRYAEPC